MASSNGGATLPATTAPAGVKQLKALLDQSADRLAAVLPKHLTPERVAQVVTTMAYRTPKLRECAPMSVLAAVMQAAELGLDLSPAMGEAYLIPRWNSKAKVLECQFQPGYKGLVALARRSGEILSVQARLVYLADEFRLAYTPRLDFRHLPYLDGEAGDVTHVYAVARLANGEDLLEVLNHHEVEAIRKRSQSPDSGPWATDWGEMAKKTALKRLCKVLPRSIELAKAIEADDRQYERPEADGPAIPRRSTPAALAARLAAPPPEEPEYAEGTAGAITTEPDDDLAGYGDEPEE